MKSLQEIISKPYFEIKGKGKVKFSGGAEGDTNFSIKMLRNGLTEGQLEFVPPDISLLTPISNFEEFNLEGKTEDDLNIVVKDCHILSLDHHSGQPPSIKLMFSMSNVKIEPDSLKSKPIKELLIKFTLVNVHEVMPAKVDTELGELNFVNYVGIKDLVKIIRSHKISLVTSELQIHTKPDGSKTLEEIKQNASNISTNFLKITSLAQTVWHGKSMLGVYEKNQNSDGYHRIYWELLYPKTKSPISLGIVNMVSFPYFVKSAWKEYSEELDDKYGFNLALEWYLDSWSASILESQFLNATTCLELLMDKFHSMNNSELIVSEEKFSDFQKNVKECVKEKAKSLGFEESTRALFYDKLGKGLNRRSYVDKARMLLEHWKIKFDDLNITIDDIVSIRNEITHRGQPSGDEESKRLFKIYKALITILTRIFLAMLNYEGDYWDFAREETIKFNTVCVKTS